MNKNEQDEGDEHYTNVKFMKTFVLKKWIINESFYQSWKRSHKLTDCIPDTVVSVVTQLYTEQKLRIFPNLQKVNFWFILQKYVP